jgi:beta-glucosidase
VTHAGVDLISGLFDNELGRTAYDRLTNGYYNSHILPDGFTPEMVTLNDDSLNRAVSKTLKVMFELGMFENPYRDPNIALKETLNKEDWDNAFLGHLKSIVLLKNNATLPLTSDKLQDKKLYVEAFNKNEQQAIARTLELRRMLSNLELTDNYNEADYAILMINPSSGNYFSATPGYLELDICENKRVCDVDESGKPISTTHLETTLANANKIKEIADTVHNNGGKVISNINFTLAWLVGNVEKYSDALLAGFDTFPEATLEVILGNYNPTGKLPITLPKSDEVIKVNEYGICISPNDVPGYDKDLYMPDSMKDENGKAYPYKDSNSKYYELNFGLSYNLNEIK